MGLPTPLESPGPDFELRLDEAGHLGLAWRGTSLFVPELGLANRRLAGFGGGRKHPLARAIGRADPRPTVLDATAGWCRDAATLTLLGYPVVACERSPIVYALAAAALQDLGPDSLLRDLDLRLQDASECLTLQAFDVVYLDPMFPTRRKRALVSKESQILQALPDTGANDTNATAQLFELARQRARARVVVKRPKRAPPLAPVDFTVHGTKVRWDVFLAPRLTRPQ